MNNYRTRSSIEESASEGVLFSAWTQTWGLKVTPWYSMDKVKFSFIQKGANGKGNSFDVCVNAKKDYSFDLTDFAHEVLHDIRTPFDFLQVMEQEAAAGEQYPKRYKFVTGSNGEKSIGVCNSKNGGYCINASSVINGKRVFANIPCTYYDIYDILSTFMRTYENRSKEIETIRTNGIRNLEENYKKYQPEVEPEYVEQPKQYSVTTISDIIESSTNYSIQVVTNGANNTLVIRKDIANELEAKNGMFSKFVNYIRKGNASFNCIAENINGMLHFVSFCS